MARMNVAQGDDGVDNGKGDGDVRNRALAYAAQSGKNGDKDNACQPLPAKHHLEDEQNKKED